MKPTRIAILSAMESEIAELAAELHVDHVASNVRERAQGQRDYWAGNLWGHDVVLAWSRWGKVAAATTTTHVIQSYDPQIVIFVGVAGGLQPQVRVGDIVVATSLVQHDLDASPLFPRHEIPLLGVSDVPADLQLVDDLLIGSREFLATDHHLVLDPETISRFGLTTPQVHSGQITSGDQFVSGPQQAREITERLPDALCVEMEGAAVAQVCHEHGVRFAVLRTISDVANDEAETDFPAFLSQVASTYSHSILRRFLARRSAREPKQSP